MVTTFPFGTWTVHPSLDGFCLLVDYTEEREGKINYRGHGIHGWDAQSKTYLGYWFDNIGVMPHEPVTATLDGTRYTYQSDDAGCFRVVSDPKSLLYIYGMQLDFSSALIGGGFNFTNPNASQTCGCGSSFAV